jgi:hypothetical protein
MRRTTTHLFLGELPHRQQDSAQLVLAEHVQHIGLVLSHVATAPQLPNGTGPAHPGVMSCGYCVEAKLAGSRQEPVELQVGVASYAGVRRQPPSMSAHVRPYHLVLENLSKVKDVMSDAELLGYAAGVFDVRHRATARVAGPAPQLHGGPDDFVALCQEERCRDRGVDPAGHGDQYLRH